MVLIFAADYHIVNNVISGPGSIPSLVLRNFPLGTVKRARTSVSKLSDLLKCGFFTEKVYISKYPHFHGSFADPPFQNILNFDEIDILEMISKEYGYFGTMWIFSINVDFFRADIRRHESQFICTELTKAGTENKTREIKREIIQI